MQCQNRYSAIMEYRPADITTGDEAVNAYESLLAEVVNAHPDDRGAEIVEAYTAEDGSRQWRRIFTDEQAARYDEVIERITDYWPAEAPLDIYEYSSAALEDDPDYLAATLNEEERSDPERAEEMRARAARRREMMDRYRRS